MIKEQLKNAIIAEMLTRKKRNDNHSKWQFFLLVALGVVFLLYAMHGDSSALSAGLIH